MRIPNSDKAIIAPEKLRDYLLNSDHRRGSSKAKYLLSCGYRSDQWRILEADLRSQHLTAEVTAVQDNSFGRRFIIQSPLQTPNGQESIFQSIWQIDRGKDVPKLITMYPVR